MNVIFGAKPIFQALAGDRPLPHKTFGDRFIVSHGLNPNQEKQLHLFETEAHVAMVLGEVLEPAVGNVASYALAKYREGGAEALYGLDGCFLFFVHDKRNGDLTVVSERFGAIPCYYTQRNGEILCSTSIACLFSDSSVDDLDLGSVRDFLRYGTLLGDATLSRRVKLLEGGDVLSFHAGAARINNAYLFSYDEDNSERDTPKLMQEVAETYASALRKCLQPPYSDTCVFLSGGMDSRFLLAMLNRLHPERIACVTMGQAHSEETTIARWTAELGGNPLVRYVMEPEYFLEQSDEYLWYTGGGDLLPQGYCMDIGRKLPYAAFATGFSLDALIGGTFLQERALSAPQSLSAFFRDNEPSFKMRVFSEEEFESLCGDRGVSFKADDEHLDKAIARYDGHRLCDAIQPFALRNRAIRLVLNREHALGVATVEHFPSLDKDFLAALTKIPARQRLGHAFYRRLFLHLFPDYSAIPYNNTTMPIMASLEEWEQGASRERERERAYAALQIRQVAEAGAPAPYYPHYYSDFDGYTRQNQRWLALLRDALFGKDCFLTTSWFDKAVICKLFDDHLQGVRNNRKKLLYLASLELFIRQIRDPEGRPHWRVEHQGSTI